MAKVEIDTIEIFHTLGECGTSGLNQKVIVIRHQAIGMTQPSVTGTNSGQIFQEHLPIIIILENVLPCITTRSEVI
jgi:hypothetical protein